MMHLEGKPETVDDIATTAHKACYLALDMLSVQALQQDAYGCIVSVIQGKPFAVIHYEDATTYISLQEGTDLFFDYHVITVGKTGSHRQILHDHICSLVQDKARKTYKSEEFQSTSPNKRTDEILLQYITPNHKTR
jgi:hypothetical protein